VISSKLRELFEKKRWWHPPPYPSEGYSSAYTAAPDASIVLILGRFTHNYSSELLQCSELIHFIPFSFNAHSKVPLPP